MQDDRPSGTALATALARAIERHRPAAERILEDPFAPSVVEAAGLVLLDKLFAAGSPREGRAGAPLRLVQGLADRAIAGLATFTVSRHRTIDEWLLESLGRGETAQVVNLGSGYDARAWRLAARLGPVPWFEVDHPATLARKRELFRRAVAGAEPCPGYREVAANFEKDDLLQDLVAAGLDRRVPAFVIWEGVTYYLERATVEATLATLARGLSPRTRLAFDFWEPSARARLSHLYRRAVLELPVRLFSEPLRTPLARADLEAMLGRHGLRLDSVQDHRALAARFGAGRVGYPDLLVALASRRALPDETARET